ncbi:MAG: SIMPL domain-containing protein [Candidatus Omnitrophota bacterium]
MDGLKVLRNTQIIILGVCIVIATIISTLILTKSLMQMKKFSNEVISVTGSAEKKIMSDYIVWRSEFSRQEPTLKLAYAALQEDLTKVRSYLVSKGIKDEEIVVSPVETTIVYEKNEKGNNTNEIEGYLLCQQIEVRSYEVAKVDMVSRQSTEIIDQDVQFISFAPEYFCTKLAELKLELLSKATENAKERARQMTQATGNKIGLMRSARMGVFQITPVNSYEISWSGSSDTSSLEKKAMAVAHVDFAIAE